MPVLCLLPLLFRFLQCLRKFHDTGKRWPHLANASKYAMSQTVTLFGAFHPLYLMHKRPEHHGINIFQTFWMAVFVGSSLFSFFWDVFMDWGLGQREYQYLGPRLMYPRRMYYYYVIAIDLGKFHLEASKLSRRRAFLTLCDLMYLPGYLQSCASCGFSRCCHLSLVLSLKFQTISLPW